MKIIMTILLAMLIACGVVYADYSGNYQFKKKGSFGDLTIKDYGNGKALFKFDNSAGMNIGELEFDTIIENGKTHYQATDDFGGCDLVITISGKAVTVKQVSGTCGAGVGVYFDGVYKKKTNNR